MKIKTAGIILLWLASIHFACADTNNITTLVQKGLFEEEANHHLDAAIESYQDAIDHFAKDRELTATAIFHLGECYRLQGKTNEANAQYQRIIHEFADQTQLAELSRNYLPKAAATVYPQSISMNLDNTEPPSEEERQIRWIKDTIRNSPDVINAVPPGGTMTPLVFAAHEGWISAVKLLLENGVEVNPVSAISYTPLSGAADAGNKGMTEFLLSKGANPNALDGRYGYTPLDYAVKHGFKTVAETLLAHGADVNAPAKSGDRPLHFAAIGGYTTMAALLVAHKAEVNAPGKDEETALFRAIQYNHLDMVKFLLTNKASVNIKSESGWTPLLTAVGVNNIDLAIVKALLDSGADVEASVKSKVQIMGISSMTRTVTPLIVAIFKPLEAQSKIVALLLEHSANPNRPDETGETPLDYALSCGYTGAMTELIAHHANVNAPDKEGNPPLAYASRLAAVVEKTDQIKQILIQAGANVDYQRRGSIFITQKGSGSIGHKVFSMDTNSINRYSLFDLIGTVYSDGDGGVAFPDFSHLAINRLKTDGSTEEIAVNLDDILQSHDCSRNPWLQWGDIILVPQLDHKIYDFWAGMTQSDRITIANCLLRRVKIIVKEQTTSLALVPPITHWYATGMSGGRLNGMSDPTFVASLINTSKGENLLYGFDLRRIIHEANVLLISSDLTRVMVTRSESKTDGHPRLMEFNLAQPGPEITLENGDVIEIPERDQK